MRVSRSACSARRSRTCSTGCSTASRRSPSARPASAANSPTSGSISAGSSRADGDASPGVATALFAVLGSSGLWTLWKTDRRAGLAAAALLGVLTVGLVFYMNFKYGYSQYPDQAFAGARGPRAGLLLHGVVLGIRRVRRAGARRADAGDRGFPARPRHAERPLGRREPGARARRWCRSWPTGPPPAGPARPWPATSPTTSSSRSSPTAS